MKRDGTACVRQFHEKKKSYVTLVVFLSKNHTTLRMTMYLVFEKMPFLLSQVRFHEAIARDERFIVFLHHVPCHLALSRPVLVFCVLWVTCDILQMYT